MQIIFPVTNIKYTHSLTFRETSKNIYVYIHIYKLSTDEQEQFAKHHASAKPYILFTRSSLHQRSIMTLTFELLSEIQNDKDIL